MYHRRSLLRNAIVSWSSDGRVAGVEVPGNVDACAGVEFYNGILVPDFVNAHCHLELSYLKGAIPQGGGFTAFARGMGEVRGLKGPEERQLAAAEADRRMWRQGIGGVRSPPMLPIPCKMRRSVRPWHRVPGRFPYTLWRVLRSVNCSKGAANWLRGMRSAGRR